MLAALAFPATVQAADITAPVTTYTKTPALPDGKNGWYKSIVTFNLQAADLETGVKDMFYRIDGGVWQHLAFNQALNLAPNGSFENGMSEWERTADNASINPDHTTYEPNFPSTSLRIESASPGWHAINNRTIFAVASSYATMSAAVSFKTLDVAETAVFKVYAISEVGGNQTVTFLTESAPLTGTNDWTRLYANFVVNVPNAIGVYLDLGLNGTGTVWLDAVNISDSLAAATTTFTVASDSTGHVIEFYSTDFAGNIEATHTVTFKQDLTPPGNWHDSGAFRGLLGPSNHHLYVYTNVEDATSGLSTFTDKYQYFTDNNPDFGRFSDLMKCSSTWQPAQWAILISPPFFPGVHSAYLLTPKTDFCNSDWKTCKTVKFYSEDLAGNWATKDLCINGPWIKLIGEGGVRSNNIIDMLSEADGDNTDGVVETAGTSINFFTTTKDWYERNSPSTVIYNYETYLGLTNAQTTISNGDLPTTSGTYLINGDFEIDNGSLPGDYDTATFNNVIFVNGNLTVSKDVEISPTSTSLFIVNGDVRIAKSVENFESAAIADGSFYNAYDINEGESSKTLNLRGLYSANKFIFQRTLQGTDNSNTPSDDFIYEPKYLIQLKEGFGKYSVKWLDVE